MLLSQNESLVLYGDPKRNLMLIAFILSSKRFNGPLFKEV